MTRACEYLPSNSWSFAPREDFSSKTFTTQVLIIRVLSEFRKCTICWNFHMNTFFSFLIPVGCANKNNFKIKEQHCNFLISGLKTCIAAIFVKHWCQQYYSSPSHASQSWSVCGSKDTLMRRNSMRMWKLMPLV